MPRQRDYHAEYVARTERQQAEGWKSYGEYRSASEKVSSELRHLVRQDVITSAEAKPESGLHRAMVEAAREVRRQGRGYQKGKPKMSDEMKARIRAFFPEGKIGDYYQALKRMY
jgi:hypothetical protein